MPAFAVLLVLLIAAAPAQAREPALSTPEGELAAALHCSGPLATAKREPVLLIHGTGGAAAEEWVTPVDFRGIVRKAGFPVCYVELPRYALGDLQVSAEYVVFAVRRMHRRAKRPIALFGHSQGGLLASWALAWWPSLRAKVADAVTVAATHHGTTWGSLQSGVEAQCGSAPGCPPALWQQTRGSNLLAALATAPDVSPGPTAWTTVRSSTDDIVTPTRGSTLKGARNILVQDVCPGRTSSHLAVVYDSVAYAALVDALRSRGPANPERFADDVCDSPFAPGVDASVVRAIESIALGVIAERAADHAPQTRAEPRVRSYAR